MTDFNFASSKINKPVAAIDLYAIKALDNTKKHFSNKGKCITEVTTSYKETLSQQLEQSNLDDTSRLLLSEQIIYDWAIYDAVKKKEVPSTDSKGLYNAVLHYVSNSEDVHGPRCYFLAQLLTQVLDRRHIKAEAEGGQWEKLRDLVLEQEIPIRDGQVEEAIIKLLNIAYREGDLSEQVDKYIKQTAIPDTSFSPAIKQSMIDYLLKIGFQVSGDAGKYDRYFALAYNEALRTSTDRDDPIVSIRSKNKISSWNYEVDTFEVDRAQEVVPANIKAAGVLDYIYCIGELMRAFDVANVLVLHWASGRLDIPEGATASLLYHFHKLRDERSTPEERDMLYKRVLNKGNGRLLSSMIANETFPQLWHQLMAQVAEYIEKRESNYTQDKFISRIQLYQATKDLQYNLTENMTGMAHLQVREDYAHLQDALEIIRSPEIVTEYGGRRKNLWRVIDAIAREDLGVSVPTSSLLTLALEGNKIFHWIANFNESVVREEAFRAFINSAEAWIVSQAAIESGTSRYRNDYRRGDRYVDRDNQTTDPLEDGWQETSDLDAWEV